MPTVRIVTGNTPREEPEPSEGEENHGGNRGGGGKRGLGGFMGIRELKHQKSIRRQLHRWRSNQWFSMQDINLDESHQAPSTMHSCLRRGIYLLLLLIGLVGTVFGLVMAVDGIRLIPCMQANNKCMEVQLFQLGDVCDFKTIPYEFTALVRLPSITSTLHFEKAELRLMMAGSDEVLVTSRAGKEGAKTPMALHEGTSKIAMTSVLNVK